MLAGNRLSWSSVIKKEVATLDAEAEELEQQRKDERRQRREEDAIAWVGLECANCGFTAQNKAGLVNHQRQKHSDAAQMTVTCQFCGQAFKRQGLKMHERELV